MTPCGREAPLYGSASRADRAPLTPAACLPAMEWHEQPWARWGATYTERGGVPVLSEESLWHLWAHHPETVQDAGEGAYWLHLDRTYRARLAPARSFYLCVPVAGRGRSA